MLACVCRGNAIKNGKHQPDLSLHWKVAHALKRAHFQLSFYTHTLKSPTCPTACSTLTLQVSRHPDTPPPAVLTAVSCIPVAEHLKNDRNGLLGQLKESWSWLSLGAINKRAAWNKQSGWQAANDGLNFKPLTWGQVN